MKLMIARTVTKNQCELVAEASCPNATDRLSAVFAFPPFELKIDNHITSSLDDHFLALGTEGILTLMTRYVSDVDIFEA